MKTSREYANQLRVLADWLDTKPEFPVSHAPFLYATYYEKEPFIEAVRATKPGKKEVTDGAYPEVKFLPNDAPPGITVELSIARDRICRKVQEVKWECEPILSAQEDAETFA